MYKAKSQYRSKVESKNAPNAVTRPTRRATCPSAISKNPARKSTAAACRNMPIAKSAAAHEFTASPKNVNMFGVMPVAASPLTTCRSSHPPPSPIQYVGGFFRSFDPLSIIRKSYPDFAATKNPHSILPQSHLRHFPVVSQSRLGLLLYLFRRKSRSHLAQHQSVRRHINHRQIRDNRVHALNRRQRITASLYDFPLPVFGTMFHGHDQFLSAHGNIHRPANPARALGSRHPPIRQIAALRDLQSAQNTNVQMAAPSHHMRIHLRKIRRPRDQCHWHLHRVHQIVIFLARLRARPHP